MDPIEEEMLRRFSQTRTPTADLVGAPRATQSAVPQPTAGQRVQSAVAGRPQITVREAMMQPNPDLDGAPRARNPNAKVGPEFSRPKAAPLGQSPANPRAEVGRVAARGRPGAPPATTPKPTPAPGSAYGTGKVAGRAASKVARGAGRLAGGAGGLAAAGNVVSGGTQLFDAAQNQDALGGVEGALRTLLGVAGVTPWGRALNLGAMGAEALMSDRPTRTQVRGQDGNYGPWTVDGAAPVSPAMPLPGSPGVPAVPLAGAAGPRINAADAATPAGPVSRAAGTVLPPPAAPMTVAQAQAPQQRYVTAPDGTLRYAPGARPAYVPDGWQPIQAFVGREAYAEEFNPNAPGGAAYTRAGPVAPMSGNSAENMLFEARQMARSPDGAPGANALNSLIQTQNAPEQAAIAAALERYVADQRRAGQENSASIAANARRFAPMIDEVEIPGGLGQTRRVSSVLDTRTGQVSGSQRKAPAPEGVAQEVWDALMDYYGGNSQSAMEYLQKFGKQIGSR